MLLVSDTEKLFLMYFHSKWSKKFLKKPLVYALDIGISEDDYLNCLKNLSILGYIKEWIIDWNTEVELTSTWISLCREIHTELKLSFFGRFINHLEKRNNIYAILIALLALIVSIIALMK